MCWTWQLTVEWSSTLVQQRRVSLYLSCWTVCRVVVSGYFWSYDCFKACQLEKSQDQKNKPYITTSQTGSHPRSSSTLICCRSVEFQSTLCRVQHIFSCARSCTARNASPCFDCQTLRRWELHVTFHALFHTAGDLSTDLSSIT